MPPISGLAMFRSISSSVRHAIYSPGCSRSTTKPMCICITLPMSTIAPAAQAESVSVPAGTAATPAVAVVARWPKGMSMRQLPTQSLITRARACPPRPSRSETKSHGHRRSKNTSMSQSATRVARRITILTTAVYREPPRHRSPPSGFLPLARRLIVVKYLRSPRWIL
ncbi:uncharacterized protein BJ171DRAFT_277627 [Polychytrium aggregatum]|uniref:uncharacterized protein n=1 Tax=Polychytrium aggregatum TaxID=110093 RepID=UPI0022FEC3AE|nr:uncharacterized protein BJ171DRAFT_277627 [Polychytrium aggregatum]KAI9207565.1 hypothetical protein BJ171DRAFT_277627 [Polychytrium aggregatum]